MMPWNLHLQSILMVASLYFLQFPMTVMLTAEENSPTIRPEITEIQALIHQADSLAEASRIDSAIVLGNLALEKAKMAFDEADTITAEALTVLGKCYYKKSSYNKAESLFEESLKIREDILGLDHPEVAQCLNYMANLYQDLGQYAEAESLYQEALAIWEKTLNPNDPLLAEIYNNLGNLHFDLSHYSRAEPLYEKALEIWKINYGSDDQNVAIALNNLASLYQDLGRYNEAESLYQQAITISKKISRGSPNVATYTNNLANLYYDLGRYTEAETLYKEAISIFKTRLGIKSPSMARELNNLASLYQDTGRYIEAESLYKNAIAIRKETFGPDHYLVALTLNNLGNLYQDLGKYAQAESLYEDALQIRIKTLGPNHPDVASSYNNLATIALETGDFAKAESLFNKSLPILESALGKDHPTVARVLNNIGYFYYLQGDYCAAGPYYERALTIHLNTLGRSHPRTSADLEGFAKNRAALGEFEKSLAIYKDLQGSSRKFIDYAFQATSEDQKMRYIEKYPIIDNSFLSLALLSPSGETKRAALEMVLNGKAVVLDAVSAEREIAYCSYDDEIIEKSKRHAQVSGEIASLVLTGAERMEPEIYRNRLMALNATRDSLEADLSRNCEEFKIDPRRKRFRVGVRDVEDALPEGAELWEFVRYGPYDFKGPGSDKERTGPLRYLAFTLDGGGDITLTDLGDASQIDSLVMEARRQIYEAREVVNSPLVLESERQLAKITGELYKRIFAPLKSMSKEGGAIFISPDGQLNLLPFEILPTPEGGYVIEKYRISYLSSGRDLLKFQYEEENSDMALVMADPDFDLSGGELAQYREKALNRKEEKAFALNPTRGASTCLNPQFVPLPLSRVESGSITKTIEEKGGLRVEAYYGPETLEETLKGMHQAPRILHLATHGFFCKDLDTGENRAIENPLLRCGLALAGANRRRGSGEADGQEDGIITAFEVSGLNLVGTELVVLSACETGLGEVRNGEGVFGLRRAFQQAGAASILMSLWKVPDKETCELMDRFYENWLGEGMGKGEALRQSSLRILHDLRKKHGVAHPLLWGGFILGGNPF